MDTSIKTSQTTWSLPEGTPPSGGLDGSTSDKPANLATVTEPIKGEIKQIGIPAISQTERHTPES